MGFELSDVTLMGIDVVVDADEVVQDWQEVKDP
jgi:hypothetical protein